MRCPKAGGKTYICQDFSILRVHLLLRRNSHFSGFFLLMVWTLSITAWGAFAVLHPSTGVFSVMYGLQQSHWDLRTRAAMSLDGIANDSKSQQTTMRSGISVRKRPLYIRALATPICTKSKPEYICAPALWYILLWLQASHSSALRQIRS